MCVTAVLSGFGLGRRAAAMPGPVESTTQRAAMAAFGKRGPSPQLQEWGGKRTLPFGVYCVDVVEYDRLQVGTYVDELRSCRVINSDTSYACDEL